MLGRMSSRLIELSAFKTQLRLFSVRLLMKCGRAACLVLFICCVSNFGVGVRAARATTCEVEPEEPHYERASDAIEKASLLAEDTCEDVEAHAPTIAGSAAPATALRGAHGAGKATAAADAGSRAAVDVVSSETIPSASASSKHGSDTPWVGCGLRVGIGSFAEPNPNFGIIEPTIAAIRKAFPEKRICTRTYSTSELERAAASGEIDLFLSSAGLYRRVLDKGVRDIASVMGPHISNPNEAEGSVFIVSRERPDILTFETMRGLRLAANMPQGFTGFLAGMKEIADRGEDPETFFGEVGFFGHDQTKVIDEVLAGRADVGIVRACTFEDIINVKPEYRARLRVVAERKHPGFACRHSTDLYPSWVLVVTRSIAPHDAARAAAAVLAAPPTVTGLHWAIGTDFSAVDNLYRTLKLGPYAFLREWSLVRVWEEYKSAIVAALLIFFGLAAHGWRSEVLVKRRTAELEAAMAQERALERRAADLREKMYALQKAGVVGQISSLIVHELGQPLGAVRLYAHGLLRSIENRSGSSEALVDGIRRIDAQASQAQSILEHVREYAKSKKERRRPTDLDLLLDDAVRNFRITSRGSIAEIVVRHAGEKTFAHVDPLEIELVVANLLKNAADALRGAERAQIIVSLERNEAMEEAVFTVADNGKRLSDEAFEKLAQLFETNKAEGLGLGLSICRTIVELHGGRMEFRRGASFGLSVSVRVPLWQPTTSEPIRSQHDVKNAHGENCRFVSEKGENR